MYCPAPNPNTLFLTSFSLIYFEKSAVISCNNSEYYFPSMCVSIPAFHFLNAISLQFPGVVNPVVYFCLT